MATVTEVLTAGTDSVNLIDGVKAGTWNVEGMEQSEINEMVQRNVDHLEIILERLDLIIEHLMIIIII